MAPLHIFGQPSTATHALVLAVTPPQKGAARHSTLAASMAAVQAATAVLARVQPTLSRAS